MHDPTYQGIPNGSGLMGYKDTAWENTLLPGVKERQRLVSFFISSWTLDTKLSVRDRERTWGFLPASLISVASPEHPTTILV